MPQSSTATWRTSAHLAGVGVDLDDGDVGAEREGGTVLMEIELTGERCAVIRGAAGELGPRQCLRRHPGHADRAGGGVDHDVGDVGFEQPRGELLGRVDHRFGGSLHGRSTDLQRA